MKTIELTSKTDSKGVLNIEYHLDQPNSSVRVLILLEEGSIESEEKEWLNAISRNPSFDFLKDDSEDIYSMNDGTAIEA